MKTLSTIMGVLFMGAVSISCQKGELPNNETLPEESVQVLTVNSDGVTSFNTPVLTPTFENTAELTAEEIEFLFAVREDEKVARDLYAHFYSKYQLKPFEMIGKAESNHISAVEKLLTFYSISFPALSEAGIFANAERQLNYTTLAASGNTSLEAFTTAAKLEETGIYDYMTVLQDITNPNIKLVIEHLMKASSNHLKAFLRNIDALGGSYTPSILSQEQFDNIIKSNFDNGRRLKKRGGDNGTNNGDGHNRIKGSVNKNGECTGTSNGQTGTQDKGKGKQGKGYRGGK